MIQCVQDLYENKGMLAVEFEDSKQAYLVGYCVMQRGYSEYNGRKITYIQYQNSKQNAQTLLNSIMI